MAAQHHPSALSSFPPSFIFSVATGVLLLIISAAGPAAARHPRNGAKNNDPCQSTDYKTLCYRFVRGVTDPQLATEQLIGAIEKHTSAVMLRPELSECKDMYGRVVDDLKKSLENIKEKDRNALQNNLSAVIANYDSCNDALTEKGQFPPPNNVNRWLSHMVANCLGLVDQIVF